MSIISVVRREARSPTAVGRPQKSNLKTADASDWTYEVGAHPSLDAYIDEHAANFDAAWAPHLVGRDFIPFDEFIGLPETGARWPTGSYEAAALQDLQKLHCLGGTRAASRKALTAYIKQSPLYGRLTYRDIQRVFGAIFKDYDGLLGAQERNKKLREGIHGRDCHNASQREKEQKRGRARRSPSGKRNILKARSDTFRAHASKLRSAATEKELKAQQLLAQAQQLSARAERYQLRATELDEQLALQYSIPCSGGCDAVA